MHDPVTGAESEVGSSKGTDSQYEHQLEDQKIVGSEFVAHWDGSNRRVPSPEEALRYIEDFYEIIGSETLARRGRIEVCRKT